MGSGSVAETTAASARDRKSTRLNSSHGYISYAVFCSKKKTVQPTTKRAGQSTKCNSITKSSPSARILDDRIVRSPRPCLGGSPPVSPSFSFFLNNTATPEIYSLSLHDGLPI